MNSVFKGFDDIPPNFEVLIQLARLLRDEYVDLQQISSLIEVDPALAASVLRLSNCAYFGCAEPSRSLDEAINRIGFSEVLKLVGLISQRMFADRPLSCYRMTSDEMWQNSLAVAILMEFIAYYAEVDPGQAYLTGLLHGIGYYPIASLVAKVKPYEVAPEGVDFVELAKWERMHVGVDHARVAAQILEGWGFHEDLSQPILRHLHPLLSGNHRREASMLHLACLLGPCITDPFENALEEIFIPGGVLNACNLDREMLEGYLSPAEAWLKTTNNLLSEQLLSA